MPSNAHQPARDIKEKRVAVCLPKEAKNKNAIIPSSPSASFACFRRLIVEVMSLNTVKRNSCRDEIVDDVSFCLKRKSLRGGRFVNEGYEYSNDPIAMHLAFRCRAAEEGKVGVVEQWLVIPAAAATAARRCFAVVDPDNGEKCYGEESQ